MIRFAWASHFSRLLHLDARHGGLEEIAMRLLLALVALSAASSAWGSVILTAYPQSANGGSTLNGTPPINVAGGFTMGGTASPLTSAKVQFGAVGIAQFATSLVSADLYGGTGGATGTPTGSPLVSFVIPPGTIAGGATDVTMTPASPFTLQASTSYWLVMHADPSVAGNLSVNTAPNPAAGAFATYSGFTQDGSLPPQSLTGANLLFEINGTPVPEPGAGCTIALSSALLIRRRRGRR
jgi:hypothetical protein